jgi:hypothetical protein
MKHLRDGGPVSALSDRVATDAFFNDMVRRDFWAGHRKEFLG